MSPAGRLLGPRALLLLGLLLLPLSALLACDQQQPGQHGVVGRKGDGGGRGSLRQGVGGWVGEPTAPHWTQHVCRKALLRAYSGQYYHARVCEWHSITIAGPRNVLPHPTPALPLTLMMEGMLPFHSPRTPSVR